MKVIIVHDPVVFDSDSWESHIASVIQGYIDSKEIECELIETDDIVKLKQLFEDGQIGPEDTFVFPNAWTTIPGYLKHWGEVYDVKFKTMGFWPHGCFINTDPVYRPKKDRQWRKVFERVSHRGIDESFFINDFFKTQFKHIVAKTVHNSRLKICKYPIDYLGMELSNYQSYFKKDAILFPFKNYEELDEQILYDLKRVFVPLGIDVIIAHEEMMLNRDQYLKTLASVKAVFMPFRYESIGVELYEAMLLNTIPLAVDWSIYGDMLPNELKYDPSITENIFNYCKDAPVITNKLKDYIENYDMYRSIVENQTQHITKTYYDSSEFLEKLFGNV
jgi:hypothetical protein